MGLNIKNDETCLLARDLVRLTGETMTGAITVALRERLAREKRQRDADAPRIEELLAIGRRRAESLGPGPSAVEHGDLLYDDRGANGGANVDHGSGGTLPLRRSKTLPIWPRRPERAYMDILKNATRTILRSVSPRDG